MPGSAQLLPGTLDLLDSQGGLARAAARLRDPSPHRPDLARRAARGTRRPLPGAVPPRSSGPAQGEVGHLGEQPPRQVLRAHRAGPETAWRGNRELEPPRGRHRARAARTAGGRMSMLAYLRSLTFRFLHRDALERELEDELRSHVLHRADDLERAGLDRGRGRTPGARGVRRPRALQGRGARCIRRRVCSRRSSAISASAYASSGNRRASPSRPSSRLLSR